MRIVKRLILLLFNSNKINIKKKEGNIISSLFLSMFLVLNVPTDYPVIYDIPLSKELQMQTWWECKKYDLSYELVLAVMKAESSFDKSAISYNNSSVGLMQLNKNTYPWLAEQLGIEDFDPFNPVHSIKGGVMYLNWLKNYWLDKGASEDQVFDLILLSYNRGLNGAKKYVKRNGLSSRYSNKIYDYKTRLEKGSFQ